METFHVGGEPSTVLFIDLDLVRLKARLGRLTQRDGKTSICREISFRMVDNAGGIERGLQPTPREAQAASTSGPAS